MSNNIRGIREEARRPDKRERAKKRKEHPHTPGNRSGVASTMHRTTWVCGAAVCACAAQQAVRSQQSIGLEHATHKRHERPTNRCGERRTKFLFHENEGRRRLQLLVSLFLFGVGLFISLVAFLGVLFLSLGLFLSLQKNEHSDR